MRLIANEDEILQRAQQGDLNAFHRIYQAYRRPLFTFIYRMTGHRQDAEDLLQEVFVKAYQRLGSFRGNSHLSTWLFSIAKNETISFLRREARRNGVAMRTEANTGWENESPVPTSGDPEDEVLEHETERVLQEALASLPETYRAAFVLGVVEGLPYEEVGKILGCTVPNVKSRVFRARAKLAHWLARNYPEFKPRNSASKKGSPAPVSSVGGNEGAGAR